EIAAGRVSALQVTRAYLRRIAALDDSGPMLSAVIEINPDAEAIARELDERRKRERGNLGPLHGVPVLLKANIDTADRMATSAGSLALAEHRARADADVVANLRAAGAVVLGKTNLSEWANFRSTKSTSGWSSLGGQTRNAYVLDRNPCGSSSGSAVAVAARLAPLAVGTETDGSIVCPAGINGVVGIKPTIGTVSQRGIVPIAHSQDTAGPLARTVADAALLLRVLAQSGAPTYTHVNVAGLRVGVVRDFGGSGREAAVETSFSAALRQLEAAGVVLVDPVMAAPPPEVANAERTILFAEFKDDIGKYLANVEAGPRTLEALIAFNASHAVQVMPHFGQEIFQAAHEGAGTAGADYASALELVAAERAALSELFREHDIVALVAPANGRAWLTNYETGSGPRIGSSRIAAITGFPSVAVPAAVVGELPIGMAFIGRPQDEATLFAVAAAFEDVRGSLPEPQFLTTVAD
ncbi:MAG TPA: amidase family protein, partial [Gammaproteobacteria bacterium]|nr:amidase family protein [Gammaproteobacteria bacterium]